MSTIFGSSRVVIYIPPNYVTTNTAQSISGLKTFTGLLTCDEGLETDSITFNDGSQQLTAYKKLVTGTYSSPQIVVDVNGAISSITSTTPIYVPTGTISMYAGGSAPTGYVLCNGVLYNSTNPLYAPLFAVIGYTYTESAGGSFFKVPDFRGVYPGMPGTNAQSGFQDANLSTATLIGPSSLGNYQYQSLPFIPHIHTSNYPNDTGTVVQPGSKSFYEAGSSQQNATSAAQNITAPNTYTIVENNIRPVTLGINYIIKL
jgi:microcystin-dependent protein